jgi:iron complex outermembrane receptor protein
LPFKIVLAPECVADMERKMSSAALKFPGLLLCLILAATALPVPVFAAEQGFALEELVVTARKREENIQDVPVSITAFDATAIEDMYGNTIGEFTKYAPNVTLARQPYAGNALFGGMRGIVFGDLEKSFDPAVGVVVDGIALVTNTSALIDTFDLEYAEILRGPQGTLFGRNTIAGVVNLSSAASFSSATAVTTKRTLREYSTSPSPTPSP